MDNYLTMEKQVNKKIEEYITDFKDTLRNKIVELKFDDSQKNELLEFVYDYNRLVVDKEDFVKRKRVKNEIPMSHRCNAKRSNGEQCSRRKKENMDYCGTHSKGLPHGLVQKEETNVTETQNLEVFAKEIGGIVYYVDQFSNVYNTEDILNNKKNPSVIAKCLVVNDVYSIPEFGL